MFRQCGEDEEVNGLVCRFNTRGSALINARAFFN